MQVNHNNIIWVCILVIVLLFFGYCHVEYGLSLSKPVLVTIGLVVLKLWLRTVNTATYILVHVLFFSGLYVGFLHYAEKLKQMSTVGLFSAIETAIDAVSK